MCKDSDKNAVKGSERQSSSVHRSVHLNSWRPRAPRAGGMEGQGRNGTAGTKACVVFSDTNRSLAGSHFCMLRG